MNNWILGLVSDKPEWMQVCRIWRQRCRAPMSSRPKTCHFALKILGDTGDTQIPSVFIMFPIQMAISVGSSLFSGTKSILHRLKTREWVVWNMDKNQKFMVWTILPINMYIKHCYFTVLYPCWHTVPAPAHQVKQKAKNFSGLRLISALIIEVDTCFFLLRFDGQGTLAWLS